MVHKHLTLGVDGVSPINLRLAIYPGDEDGGIDGADEGAAGLAGHGAFVTGCAVQAQTIEVAELISELTLPGAQHDGGDRLLPPGCHVSVRPVLEVDVTVLLSKGSTLQGDHASRLAILGLNLREIGVENLSLIIRKTHRSDQWGVFVPVTNSEVVRDVLPINLENQTEPVRALGSLPWRQITHDPRRGGVLGILKQKVPVDRILARNGDKLIGEPDLWKVK